MAVLSLLTELYHFAESKLNLKFEIAMLCKALDIDLDILQATTILRNRPLSDSLAVPPLPDYVGDIDSLPMGGYDPTAQAQGGAQVIPLGLTSPSDTQRVLGTHIENILSSITPHVIINPQLAPFDKTPSFKRAIQMVVDRVVREARLSSAHCLTH